ncbi:alginate lyase family protein [Desulfomonile tiedjei]|uniref:Heparinase II/III-like protein n=1 Tax=Desulfomonile tiedjei (strain ATCC 49306 / DSM 6799 / DCB-1) TaxID=706587 RepID=I4C7Z1_DESTA|nr:alginate lyase family protein [Desulfomonile tiedjei]AFM25682.1 Heparinase II/III-like protein [Desulfomonile tiedjei DSM 6799]
MSLRDRVIHYGPKAMTLPLRVLARKVWRKALTVFSAAWQRRRDLNHPPYSTAASLSTRPIVPLASLDLTHAALQDLPEIAVFYMEHRFDLLGSGWVRWGYAEPSPGLEGHTYDMRVMGDPISTLRPAHRKEAERLKALIDDPNYQPIDWQKDVKSGFRFDESQWYRDQPIGTHPGADIKMPWELGRLQHLPQMALTAALLREMNPEMTHALAREFRCQVLDFLAMNPPCNGSQWTCTMDVGIRAANLVLAYDIFNQLECADEIDDVFRAELAQALRRHGQHIVANLEWTETLTSNHYLANLCGMLFVAATLESTPETDAWLAFAAQQLDREFFRQFCPDGVNFEASTNYHRLSLEMIVFSTALLLGLPQERLLGLISPDSRYLPKEPHLATDWPERAGAAARANDPALLLGEGFLERLTRAACFIVDITKHSGEIPQIGDNDSGRFFRLTPLGEWMTPEEAETRYLNLAGYTTLISTYRRAGERYFDDNILRHHAVIGAAAGIIDHPSLSSGSSLEKSICAALARGRHFACEVSPLWPTVRPSLYVPEHKTTRIIYEDTDTSMPSLTEEGSWTHYPDAGIHIYRSGRVHLTVSAGPNGQNGNGGHAHNDKLSFELQIDGVDLVQDPGTYLYTAAVDQRNLYRSTAAHNAPCLAGHEQNRWEPGIMGLFWMHEDSSAWVSHVSGGTITLDLRLSQGYIFRRLAVEDRRVIIEDFSDWPDLQARHCLPFSNGYGRILRSK